jgi:iron complex outermembrane receptor protein
MKENLYRKNSINNFSRVITVPDYLFDGVQTSTFSEFTYANNGPLSQWVAGANLYTDEFKEDNSSTVPLERLQPNHGAFIQNTVKSK